MSGRTRIKLPWQTKVSGDVDLNSVSLRNLVMPEDKASPEATSPTDVINRQYVEGIVGAPGGGGKIGSAEDGTYDDGLFQDFTSDTLIGTAVDRFNEILKGLAPAPAPNLSDISINDSGVTGKLSFGSSNNISGYTNHPSKDLGDTFGSGSQEAGIFSQGTLIDGYIAGNVVSGGANDRPYPARAFADGDKGTLHLEVNGTIVHSTDLTSFGGGTDANANGSGFVLSSAQSIEFDSGEALDLFKYRTGSWRVAGGDQLAGYNKIRLRHEYAPGLYRDTDVYEWIVDDDTTDTAFSGESLTNATMAGSRELSGVTYHTSGTVDYSVVISNAYRNTYSQASNALNYSGQNVVISDQTLPQPSTESDDVTISGQTIQIDNSNRLLNDSVSVGVRVDRTLNSDITSPGQSISGFLVDNITDNSTDNVENFNGEDYRIHTGIDINDTSYGSGGPKASAYDWDSGQHLVSGDANHNTGLLISGGRLSYPSNTDHIANISAGDFSVAPLGPGGNPDYQTASGDRTYLRYFYSPLSYSNFRLDVNCSNTTFVPLSAGPSGNNVTLEILAPNTTKNNVGAVEWKDAVEPHNANDRDIGCFASTFGDTIPTNWGITIGTENTSTSGHVIVVRITASASWSGSIESMTLTWL